MKQCFSEKIPVATVSKLELFTNTGSTPNIQKTQKSWTETYKNVHANSWGKQQRNNKESLSMCLFFFFPELFQHHYGLTRKTSIKNSLFLVQKAVSASFVNYKLTPEKTRFVPNSVHQHKILFLSPWKILTSKTKFCTAPCFNISTHPWRKKEHS